MFLKIVSHSFSFWQIFILVFIIKLTPFQKVYGQSCLPAGIDFEFQSEIDNFSVNYPGCSMISGNVRIGFLNPTNISNLSGLSQLTHINGSLTIFNNPILGDLNGLHNLTTVDSFFHIDQNNTSLTDLSGLENLTFIGDHFTISNNNGLLSLEGLDNLSSIDGYLYIAANGALTDLTGLEALSSINGYLRVSGHSALTSLSGIDNIDHTTISNLLILANPMMSICHVQSVCDYLSIPTNPATIDNNITGCNTRAEVEAACDAPLPLIIVSFDAIQDDNDNILLTWHTSEEVDHKAFYVEKSQNAVAWITLASIKDNQAIANENYYSYLDKNPSRGQNYYRLKQIDISGEIAYSEVKSILLKDGGVVLYPNPTSGIITIESSKEIFFVKIVNYQGSELMSFSPTSYTLDLTNLTHGLYFLKIYSHDQKSHIRRVLKMP